jgi:N-acetyl-1-D-myo-inositol-2-amino-2-deoxy-alpha-D-glucopyranoside deacetylase
LLKICRDIVLLIKEQIIMPENRVMLAVLAHPDDESFGMGGTLALYAERGVQVYLVCATRGEVGIMESEYLEGYNSSAERREAELRCAAEKLGLAGVYFLDYRDSGMPGSPDNEHPRALVAQPLEDVAAKVVHYIRELKPQVVVTFDPIGGYRHPDHIAIHKATVLAFEQAGKSDYATDELNPYQPQRLYFHTVPRGFLRLAVKLMPLFGKDPHKWGRNEDIDLVPLAEVDFPTDASINISSVVHKKEDAGACHASQGGGSMLSGLTGFFMRMTSNKETFMRAYPKTTSDRPREKDLFQNVAIGD